MKPTQKIEAVERKVREACPELMELSFGCEVEYSYRNDTSVDIIVCEDHEHTDSISVMRKHNCDADGLYVSNYKIAGGYPYVNTQEVCDAFADVYQHTKPITKIIGHPIHLEHVASVVEMLCEDDEEGNTRPTADIPEMRQLLNMWKFSQTFSENMQDEALVELLYSILCERV